MIKKDDVIKIKINDFLTEKDKIKIYKFSIDFVKSENYYNRQGGDFEEQVKKTYRGFVAEKLIENYIINKNETGNYDIIFDGLLNYNSKQKADLYDVKINDRTIDIKSSKENKKQGEYINTYLNKDYGDDFISFALDSRNFILPVDQTEKEFIIQVLYDYTDTYVYIMGIIDTATLIKQKPVNLKVSYNKKQLTYMINIKYGYSLEYFLNNI